MTFLVNALFIFAMGGLFSLCTTRRPFLANCFGAGGAILGSIVGLIPATQSLLDGTNWKFEFSWSLPGGNFGVGIDPLSAIFLVLILFLGAVTALYGAAYLWPYRSKKSLGVSWALFNGLLISMVLVVVARNAMLFLLAWECMALASYFLVVFEHEKIEVQKAGWTYLAATHLGTLFLLILFAILGAKSGSLNFNEWTDPPVMTGALFLMAVIGFGTKAGLVPFHVWLPEAHPAAPSHVSALMSGAMIKTGIYGLLRVLEFLGPPNLWWCWCLIVIGVMSGIFGILAALAQHDFKKLLAYSSVENIGVISMGLGIGLLGVKSGLPLMAILGFAGSVLHIVNHGLFKGLLFLGAGAVYHATGTRKIDRLGGLMKKIPWTGILFLIGSAAISALPFLNGFVSEFLIFLGVLDGIIPKVPSINLAAIISIAGLALIGGLVLACFTKSFGVIFLGEPREPLEPHNSDTVHESPPLMLAPMFLLAACCAVIGLFPSLFVTSLAPVLIQLTHLPQSQIHQTLNETGQTLQWITRMAIGFALVLGLAAGFRRLVMSRKFIRSTGTWDCGYARPTARMQYTASSFAQPLTDFFRGVLGMHDSELPPQGCFPSQAKLQTRAIDIFREKMYDILFSRIRKWSLIFQRLQNVTINYFILYILVSLIGTLFWEFK